MVLRGEGGLSRSCSCSVARVRRRRMGISSVLATDSSGGSSERLGVDFGGDPALISDLVARSGRPDRLDVADE